MRRVSLHTAPEKRWSRSWHPASVFSRVLFCKVLGSSQPSLLSGYWAAWHLRMLRRAWDWQTRGKQLAEAHQSCSILNWGTTSSLRVIPHDLPSQILPWTSLKVSSCCGTMQGIRRFVVSRPATHFISPDRKLWWMSFLLFYDFCPPVSFF